MAEFTPERLYVPLDNEDETTNRSLGSALRLTGVRVSIGANATELSGMRTMLSTLSKQGYRKTFADMHYSSVGGNIHRSLRAFEKLHTIGHVSVDGRDSERSLRIAAAFNNGLQIVAKGIDSDMSEAEYLQRFGRSIDDDTLSICETARACGISAIMLAGADVELVASRYPEMSLFATGIRPQGAVEGIGDFADDQERIADPIAVLSAGGENVRLMCGRPITSAREPDLAVGGLITYINKG